MPQHSIWELETFLAPKDIIIAGSGLAGLWSAWYLKKFQPDLNILVIEKEIFPGGASTRNAGFACFGSVTELLEDVQSMGEEQTLRLLNMRWKGLGRIRKIFSDKEIGYDRYGGYELISQTQFTQETPLKEAIKWLNSRIGGVVGHKHVFALNARKLKKYAFGEASQLIENRLEGQLHSGMLVQAFIRKLQCLGVVFMNGTELKGFEPETDKVRIYTHKGLELRSRNLLVCTNAYAGELLPGAHIVPARGQMLLTAPVKNLLFRGTFHYDAGYYYFRNLGNRILLGGARNKAFEAEQTTSVSVTDTIQQELQRFLREVIIPGEDVEIENRWSGIMGMAADKFPVVENVGPHCFCALGMGGMGVALAPVVGEQVARLILGSRKKYTA